MTKDPARLQLDAQFLSALALAGPLRVAFGIHQPADLPAGKAISIQKNGRGWPSFVRVVWEPNQAVLAPVAMFSRSAPGGPQASLNHDLAGAPFDCILLPEENLFARANTTGRVIVTEVTMPLGLQLPIDLPRGGP